MSNYWEGVFVCVFVVVAVPSSVPTSEGPLPLRSSRRSYFRPHPRLIPHRGPAPRGSQEETSDFSWAVIRRRHCSAAESLSWCSVVPALIQQTQDIACYARYAGSRRELKGLKSIAVCKSVSYIQSGQALSCESFLNADPPPPPAA